MEYDYYRDLIFYGSNSWNKYFPSRFNEHTEYDVIIVGSGMGGGILADATSDHGLKTLVIEAGPIRHLINITDLPIPNSLESFDPYEQVEGTDLRGGVSFNLGGRSIFWSAVIPRMLDWELDYWPAEVAGYLRRDGYDVAERLFRKRVDYPPFQEDLLSKVGSAFPEYKVSHLPRSYHQPDSSINPRAGSPDERTTGVFSTAALLTSSLTNSGKAGGDNLDVALQHVAHKIEWSGRRATAIIAYDLQNGVRRSFRGRQIVLAAGTTESARIALTSALKDESGLIGVGPTDHPEAAVQFCIPHDSKLFSPDDQGNLYLRPKELTSRDGFSCELALNWKFWDIRIDDDDLWRQRLQGSGSTSSTVKFLFRSPLNNENFIRIRGNKQLISVAPMEGRPMLENVSKLAEEVLDFFGADRSGIDVHYNRHSITFHLGGSLRMGDWGRSVVDSNLRFHEYENLFCCDLSVFPDIPASNPSLTIGALALRLAKQLQ